MLNTADDYRRLIDVLRGFEQPVTIGFEATGNYHRALMFALGSAGFELKLVSSIALARTREALHNSWDKNDPKDAQVILRMLEIGAVQVFHDPLVAGTCGIFRCVERCCPSTRQANRSEIRNFCLTCSMQARRRAGLRSFPRQPPAG